MRDTITGNSIYIYFGVDKNGDLVLQNRTRWSMHPGPAGTVLSPFNYKIKNHNVKDYPYLKLVRSYKYSAVAAYASKDGENWELVGRPTFTPMPQVSYVGVVGTKNAKFDNVKAVETKFDTELLYVAASNASAINIDLSVSE